MVAPPLKGLHNIFHCKCLFLVASVFVKCISLKLMFSLNLIQNNAAVSKSEWQILFKNQYTTEYMYIYVENLTMLLYGALWNGSAGNQHREFHLVCAKLPKLQALFTRLSGDLLELQLDLAFPQLQLQ